MVVPDFVPVPGAGGAGVEATGLRGAPPARGGVTTTVAAAGEVGGVGWSGAGAMGLMGLTGEMAPGPTGLIGVTVPGAALAPGRIGAGGMTGLTGVILPGGGMTGGGGPTLGEPATGVGLGGVSMICVLLGGATVC